MTNGELFVKENPTVETKLNGSCVWIYYSDGVNHYTMPTSWWEQEISLFDKLRVEIEDYITRSPYIKSFIDCCRLRDDVMRIFDNIGSMHKVLLMGAFDKLRAELHATAEMHEDGDYYLRDEWIDDIFDKYRNEASE